MTGWNTTGMLYAVISLFTVIGWNTTCMGEDFSEIDQSETRIACGGHVC